MEEPLLLAIETATEAFSVCLSSGETILAEVHSKEPRSHAKLIAVSTQDLLQSTGFTTSALNGVIVSAGPGSYTGLRIGVGAAKGLCFALNIPLIAVPTMEGIASQVAAEAKARQARIAILLDARRMEVYTSTYSSELELLAPALPVVVDEAFFAQLAAKGPCLLVGDGVAKCEALIKTHTELFTMPNVGCKASGLIPGGYRRWLAADFADLALFEPEYLKSFATTTPKVKPSLI
jgi:tRNA threonylcarbamoyladenosine biosynthesis protein TsaB